MSVFQTRRTLLFLLRQPVGRNQKFRQKPETTEVDERIIGEIVEKSVEIIDTVFQNRDPTGIQPIGAGRQ